MSKIKQTKIPMQVENFFELIAQGEPNWKLVRERDGLTKHSVDVMKTDDYIKFHTGNSTYELFKLDNV